MYDVSTENCACGCGKATRVTKRGVPNRYILGHNRRGAVSPEGWIEQGTRFVWVDGKKRPLHRLIMEELSGRPLRPDEIVRHRDGDLLNNDPDNLVVVSREEHFELSMCAEAREPWSEEEKDDAVRLYCAGMTIDEVARAVHRSYSSTRRTLMLYGVLRPPHLSRRIRTRTRVGGTSDAYSRDDSALDLVRPRR